MNPLPAFDKIVGFGDSWVYGDELLDPGLLAESPDAQPFCPQNRTYRESHCFLGILGQHYKVDTENFGWPGSSLQSALWNFIYWLEHESDPSRCLVLFGLTEASRASFWHADHKSYGDDPPWNRHMHSAWVLGGDDWLEQPWCDMIRLNTVLTQCAELSRMNFLQTVLLVDAVCQQRNITCLQFNLISKPPVIVDLTTLIWPQSCLAEYLNELSLTRPVHCRGKHPNELGHRCIAERLQPHIARVTIHND